MIVDAVEQVGEPSLQIEVVNAPDLGECVDDGGALAAAVGAGERPCLTAGRNAAQVSPGVIVSEADTPIVEERAKATQRFDM